MILNLTLAFRLRNLNRPLIDLGCKRSTRRETSTRVLLIIRIGGIRGADILFSIAGEGEVEGLGGDLFGASVDTRGLYAFDVGAGSCGGGVLPTVD